MAMTMTFDPARNMRALTYGQGAEYVARTIVRVMKCDPFGGAVLSALRIVGVWR